MIRRGKLLTVLIAITLGGAGCSSGLRGSAGALRDGDPTRAVSLAQASLAQNENDWASWRDLGIALHRLDRHAEAIPPLDRALRLRSEDRQSLLFRARAFDALDSIPKAIEAYGAYIAHARGRELSTVRGRMDQLRRAQATVDVKHALARERELSKLPLQKNTIAVPDFANPANTDTLRPVAKGLAIMTITDLLRIDSLRVVERERLSTLLDELRRTNPPPAGAVERTAAEMDPLNTAEGQQQRLSRLVNPDGGGAYFKGKADGGASPELTEAVKSFQKAHGLTADGIAGPMTQTAIGEEWARADTASPLGAPPSAFDAATAPRMGRLLGAQRIVQGSVLPLGSERIQLSADLENSQTSEAQGSTPPIEGKFIEILTLQKHLTFAILELLGIRPSGAQRRQIEEMETRNLDAFLAYCRGLDLEDRGLRTEALQEYRNAINGDPGFGLAGRSAASLSVGSSELQGVEQSETSSLSGESRDVGDRAIGTGNQLGISPTVGGVTGFDTRSPDNLRGGRVVVEGELPGGGRK